MEKNNTVTDRKSQPAAGESVSAAAGKPAAAEKTTENVAADKPAAAEPVDETPLIPFDEVLAILATSKSRASGGAKIRNNIGYTLVHEKMGELRGTNVPEQEQVIVKIMLKALTTQRPVISEPELNKLILAAHASGALKTKQDAWHIFRYYRTDLKKRGVLRELELELAAA